MAVHYKTKGFILKKEDRLESDRIFTVFTYDFGRIEIFGKAIRRIASKLKGGIDIFSLSEITLLISIKQSLGNTRRIVVVVGRSR